MDSTNSLPELEPAEPINLKQRFAELDEQRLAELPDAELVATINQRRYLADLKQEHKWKKEKERQQHPTHYRRYL